MTTEQTRSTPAEGATVPAAAVVRLIHDLNGLLAPIVGFTELLAAGTVPEETRPRALRAVGQAGKDLAERLRLAQTELFASP